MPDIIWNEFSVTQLKKWLEALGRQTSGTKAELIVRLQAISPETRGDSPPNNGSAAEEVEELDGAAAWPKQKEPQGGDTRAIPFDEQSLLSESLENLDLDQLSLVDTERATLKKLRDEIEANMAVLQRIQADIDDANKSKSAQARQINDVIENNSNGDRDNVNICANSTDANVNSIDAKVNSTKVTIAADNIDMGHTSVGKETAGSVVQHQSRIVNKLLESPATSLALAKEVTMEFDGSLCARNWVTQFQNIGKIYNLDDGCMHMLLIAKLKGDAQRWLHASATRILESTDQLCEQLILTFEVKMSKGELRNAFQKREWHPDEKFAVYFEDKVMLANDINIDLEELLENIIEGIPAPALRNQARIQCFSEPMQILRAFSEVRLPKHKTGSGSAKRLAGGGATNKDLRCANCNSKGHFARECLKPKREPGSCYACGAFGHFVGQCAERKSANINNYNAS
ncbi:uncharacterized protein LOC116803388 [Drosophila sechellia]|uniref:uncharacterized protein LOC116803388 n=1 Tax=Drosophila sechellia TaxID=7238 RepID=UPI0013DDB624|nr:uncharacterized protein LOC116803388 [Drosophila sechellia]